MPLRRAGDFNSKIGAPVCAEIQIDGLPYHLRVQNRAFHNMKPSGSDIGACCLNRHQIIQGPKAKAVFPGLVLGGIKRWKTPSAGRAGEYENLPFANQKLLKPSAVCHHYMCLDFTMAVGFISFTKKRHFPAGYVVSEGLHGLPGMGPILVGTAIVPDFRRLDERELDDIACIGVEAGPVKGACCCDSAASLQPFGFQYCGTRILWQAYPQEK